MTRQENFEQIVLTLAKLAEYYNFTPSGPQLKMYAEDLEEMLCAEEVGAAAKCWRQQADSTRFPYPSQLIAIWKTKAVKVYETEEENKAWWLARALEGRLSSAIENDCLSELLESFSEDARTVIEKLGLEKIAKSHNELKAPEFRGFWAPQILFHIEEDFCGVDFAL